MSTTVTIKPAEGRRLIVPFGCQTLDGVPIAAGQDLPAAGAVVPRGIWAARALGREDAVTMTDDEVAAWKTAKAKADADAAAPSANKTRAAAVPAASNAAPSPTNPSGGTPPSAGTAPAGGSVL